MHCKNCGAKLNESDKVCSYCGGIVSNVQDNNQNLNSQFQTNQINSINQTASSNNQSLEQKKVKKKNYWWIPISLFIGGFLSQLISLIIKLIVVAGTKDGPARYTESSQYTELGQTISSILGTIAIIAWFLVVPSIIVVIILNNKKGNNDNSDVYDNYMNNATSLDEKLLVAYIGDNYNKITKNKFNFSAWFFSLGYIAYRKMYLHSIIFMAICFVMNKIPIVGYICNFILVILLGFYFNKMYINHAKKQIEIIKQNNKNSSENDLIDMCKNKGGKSVFWVILVLIIGSIITSII